MSRASWLIAALVVMAAVAIAVRARLRRPAVRRGSGPRDPGRTRRRAICWGLGLVGVVAAVASAEVIGQRAIFLFSPLAVSGYLAGLVLGELMMPNAVTGPLRRGSLDPRSVGRYLSPRWVWGWRFAAGAAMTAVASAGIAGAADGRTLLLSCGGGGAAGASPWPGWSFGGPALAALGIGFVLVELCIQRAVGRPRPDPALADLATDEANRAASLRRAVAAGYAIALVPLAGVSLSAAIILSFICSPPYSLAWTGPLAVALAILGFAAGIGAVGGLVALAGFTEDDLAAPRAGSGPSREQKWS